MRPVSCSSSTASSTSASPSLVHANTFPQSAPIVDFVWYPGASQHNPPAFCVVASVRDCPVKLLDGRDGRVRGEIFTSYLILPKTRFTFSTSAPRVVSHRRSSRALYCAAWLGFQSDCRQVRDCCLTFVLKQIPLCMSCSFVLKRCCLPPARLYCGFEDAIEIFDVQKPGEGERLPTTPSKKSKDGLKGERCIHPRSRSVFDAHPIVARSFRIVCVMTRYSLYARIF